MASLQQPLLLLQADNKFKKAEPDDVFRAAIFAYSTALEYPPGAMVSFSGSVYRQSGAVSTTGAFDGSTWEQQYEIGATVGGSGGGSGTDDQTALEVPYTPSGSLTSTNVQGALDELAAGGSGTDDQTAAEVSYDNSTSGLTGATAQAAIDELAAASVAALGIPTDTTFGGATGAFPTITAAGEAFRITGTAQGGTVLGSTNTFRVHPGDIIYALTASSGTDGSTWGVLRGQGLASWEVFTNAGGAGAVALDFPTGRVQLVSLTANSVVSLTNPGLLNRMAVKFTQDATGSRTLTWPAGATVVGDLNSAANSETWAIIEAVRVESGTVEYVVNLTGAATTSTVETLIGRQALGAGDATLFFGGPADARSVNLGAPTTDARFSDLKSLENYRDSEGRLRFKLEYLSGGGSVEVLEWYQTSHPLARTEAVEGFVAIDIAAAPTFGGICRSSVPQVSLGCLIGGATNALDHAVFINERAGSFTIASGTLTQQVPAAGLQSYVSPAADTVQLSVVS